MLKILSSAAWESFLDFYYMWKLQDIPLDQVVMNHFLLNHQGSFGKNTHQPPVNEKGISGVFDWHIQAF